MRKVGRHALLAAPYARPGIKHAVTCMRCYHTHHLDPTKVNDFACECGNRIVYDITRLNMGVGVTMNLVHPHHEDTAPDFPAWGTLDSHVVRTPNGGFYVNRCRSRTMHDMGGRLAILCGGILIACAMVALYKMFTG